MRRVKKIVMMTVAILLCLVLFSTSILSGIYAKFIIKKDAQISAYIERFGVTIRLTPNTTAGKLVASQENTDNGVVASMSFTSDLAMEDTIYDALKVEVTGTPNVNVKFKMSCQVEFDTAKYTVDSNSIYGGAKGKTYMPLGFTVKLGESGTQQYICRPYHIPADDNRIDEMIIRNTANKVCGFSYNKSEDPKTPYDSSQDRYYFEKTFSEEINGNINCFYLGFDWLGQYNSYPTSNANTNNLIATHISEKAAGSAITITYMFYLEQTN